MLQIGLFNKNVIDYTSTTYHVTTELDFLCGVVEKLSLRAGVIGVGDVAGVEVVELLGTPWFGAVNKCNVGAELPICMTSDGDVAFFTNVTVAPPLLNGFVATIRTAFRFVINGDSSSRLVPGPIRTSAGLISFGLGALPNQRQ